MRFDDIMENVLYVLFAIASIIVIAIGLLRVLKGVVN